MIMAQIASLEEGGWKEIARGTPVAIPGLTIQMEPGVLYEVQYIAQDPVTAGISWITAQINAAISSLFGVRTEYVRVEGKTIHHGFMIPQEASVRAREMGLILPAIGGVIALVAAVLIIIGILLIIVYLFVPGGKETVDKLLKSIPGMLVMMVGGVIVSVLPKFAKVAGLVPLGIGGWMVVEAFVGSPSSPPSGGEEPPPGEETADITLIRVD